MIGGIEVQIGTVDDCPSMEIAARAIRQGWRSAVYQHGVTAQRYASLREIPFGQLDELFVYRDADAADGWDDFGAIPELANLMIHLLVDEGWLTIVVDDLSEEMTATIDAIRSGLSNQDAYVPEPGVAA